MYMLFAGKLIGGEITLNCQKWGVTIPTNEWYRKGQ